MTPMPASGVGPKEVVKGYEALREEALTGGRGLGLALFLRDGMASWMRAWMEATAAQVHPNQAAPGPAPGARSDLVAILAQMILSPRVEG